MDVFKVETVAVTTARTPITNWPMIAVASSGPAASVRRLFVGGYTHIDLCDTYDDGLGPKLDIFNSPFSKSSNMATLSSLNLAQRVLSYLGLPDDYEPSPVAAPVQFLSKHLRHLPPSLLGLFSPVITPKQRTMIPAIRNRRLRFAESEPSELRLSAAKATWPTLWPGKMALDMARETAKDEKDWADKEFMGGAGKQVGKLGELLGGYEEERGAERARDLRRQQREWEESLPEEDDDTDDEEYDEEEQEELSSIEADAIFLRRVKERFIYGLLDVSVALHIEETSSAAN